MPAPAADARLGSSSTNSTLLSALEKGAAAGTEHHPQITVTGADVGVAVSPSAASTQPAGEAAAADGEDADDPPAPNLLGDLISAASGESNGTSIGQVLDKALAKEFAEESNKAESGKGRTFNETVASEEAKVETVVRISAGKSRDKEQEHTDSSSSGSGSSADGPSNTTGTASSGSATSSTAAGGSSISASNGAAGAAAGGSGHGSHSSDKDVPSAERGVDRIIDSQDNEFVLSAPPKDQMATLTLDPLLIQDLTFLFASAAVRGVGRAQQH